MSDRTSHDEAAAHRDGDHDADAPQGRAVPDRRLMAEGLPDWDLEPPTLFIRRGER
jgi:hypothetical protein